MPESQGKVSPASVPAPLQVSVRTFFYVCQPYGDLPDTNKIWVVVEDLLGKMAECDRTLKTTLRDLRRINLDIRDLQRSDDEQLRNFLTVSDVIDNIRDELKDFREISTKLATGQEMLSKKIDRLVH